MKLCGAFSSTPGPEHEHEAAGAAVATTRRSRTLVTLRGDRPAEHVEADRVADVDLERSLMNCSIDTSALVRRASASQICPATIRLVRLERRRDR